MLLDGLEERQQARYTHNYLAGNLNRILAHVAGATAPPTRPRSVYLFGLRVNVT